MDLRTAGVACGAVPPLVQQHHAWIGFAAAFDWLCSTALRRKEAHVAFNNFSEA